VKEIECYTGKKAGERQRVLAQIETRYREAPGFRLLRGGEIPTRA
jgi:hypothetical protein